MKKWILLVVVAAASLSLVGGNIYYNATSDPNYMWTSPIKIEKTEWYIDNGADGAPWFYLKVIVTNTSDKNINAIKSYIGADLFWYDENGKLGGVHSGNHNPNYDTSIGRSLSQLVYWPMNGHLKSGQTQTYYVPFHSVKYEFGSLYNIHSLVSSTVLPYWVDFSGFGGSWGNEKNFYFKFINSLTWRDMAHIPDFNPIESS